MNFSDEDISVTIMRLESGRLHLEVFAANCDGAVRVHVPVEYDYFRGITEKLAEATGRQYEIESPYDDPTHALWGDNAI